MSEAEPGKVRRKMAVGEGRSMMHWLNLRPNVKRLRRVTMSEVKKHNTREDCWSVYRGKVYDMTPFFEYHPGGPKYILMAAGKDGTKLFDKYHKWVNIDFIMEKCFVGILVNEDGSVPAPGEESESIEEEESEQTQDE
ncbi:hypothetical protein GUITHDRAFT_96532, partial [Guillardia theta CCMP2712]